MGCSNLLLIVYVLWVFCISTTHELQSSETQDLLQLRKHLEYPVALQAWENYNGDLCYMPSTLHVSITCHDNIVSELKIMGNNHASVSEFYGFAVPDITLSERFSIDSFVTTLTRLSGLRVLNLVSLGIWGPLPDKIHRLRLLEVLDMSSNFMFGSIPPELSRLVKLHTLTFDSNYFNDTVPDWLDLLSNLTILSIKNNRLKGLLPSSISKVTTLADMSLSHNKITGKLPDMSALSNLHLLDMRENGLDSELPLMPRGLTTILLSKNSLSGTIPRQFSNLNQLQHLDLSSNFLTGEPPAALFSLPNISYLNLGSNMLSGSLPDNLTCGDELGFVDISSNRLIGRLPSCLSSTSQKRIGMFGGNCLSINTHHQHPESFCKVTTEKEKSRGRSTAVLIGVIGGIVVVVVLLTIYLLALCRRYSSREEAVVQHTLPKLVQQNAPSGMSPELLANARIISESAKLGTQGSLVYQVFSLEELEEATNDFDESAILGEGSAGKLYKGRLDNGIFITVRVLPLFRKYSVRNLKLRLDLLSKLRHPHLVGLLGHCIDGGGQDDSTASRVFLVYEFVPNGNFRAHLSANNRAINFGEIILKAILKKMGSMESRQLHTGNKVRCFYPRFLTLILNDKLIPAHKAGFENGPYANSLQVKTHLFTSLTKRNKLPNIPVVLTDYMAPLLLAVPNQQVPQRREPAQQRPVPQAEVEPQVSSANPLVQREQLPVVTSPVITAPQVGFRNDDESEIPQAQTTVLEPNTESLHPPEYYKSKKLKNPLRKSKAKRPREIQGDESEGDQGGSLSEPLALSPPKKRSLILETPRSPSFSSQQDLDFEMALQQSLESFSQQDDSIEFSQYAMAFCQESSTLSPLTVAEQNLDEASAKDTPEGEHREDELTETSTSLSLILREDEIVDDSVMDQMLSRVSEGKFEIPPQLKGSFSPLQEGTFPAPLRDFPSADLSGEDGRQLIESTFVDSTEEFQIVPFLTATDDQATEPLSDTPMSETHSHTHSELIHFLNSFYQSVQQTNQSTRQAESSTASVSDQIKVLRDDLDTFKSSILIKTTDIQTTQAIILEDVKSTLTSQVETELNVLDLQSLEKRMKKIEKTSASNTDRLYRIEVNMENLNRGMKRILEVVESLQKPTPEHKEDNEPEDEDPSTKGENPENRGDDQEDKGGSASEAGGAADDQDKSKGKEPMQDDADYYAAEQEDWMEEEDAQANLGDDDQLAGESEQSTFNIQPPPVADPDYELVLAKLKAEAEERRTRHANTKHLIGLKMQAFEEGAVEKQRLHMISQARRKIEVEHKIGTNWDNARKIISRNQSGPFEDRPLIKLFNNIKSANSNHDLYMKALAKEIKSINLIHTILDDAEESYTILLRCHGEGTFRVSLEFFKSRSLSENWILLNKVERTTDLNELLRDKLREYSQMASPEIIRLPHEIRFLKNNLYQTIGLSQSSLRNFSARHLIEAEHMLRSAGFESKEKSEAADILRAYCEVNIKKYHQMKASMGIPLQPAKYEKSPVDQEVDFQLANALQRRLYQQASRSSVKSGEIEDPGTPLPDLMEDDD